MMKSRRSSPSTRAPGGGVIRQRDDIAGALGVAKDAVRVHRSGATTPTYHLTGVAPLSGMEQNRLKGV
jgi:hypothetical protein